MPEGTVYVSGREHEGRTGTGWSRRSPSAARRPRAAGGPRLGRRAGTRRRRRPATAELDGWLQPAEGTGEADKDPTDDVLPQVRIADLIQHVDQDLYGAYGVATEPEPGWQRASLDQLPERRGAHRLPQPALRDRVVVLRPVRGVHLVALGDRGHPSRTPRATRRTGRPVGVVP